MAISEKPALRVSEVRRLSTEEGWDDMKIALYFGVRAVDITDIRRQKGIQKKRVYQPRYVLIDDEEEVATSPGESVMAETVEQEVEQENTPMEEQAVEAVTEETITEQPEAVEPVSTTTESTTPTSTGW